MTAYDTSFGNNRVIRLQLPGGKGPLTKPNTILNVFKQCFEKLFLIYPWRKYEEF